LTDQRSRGGLGLTSTEMRQTTPGWRWAVALAVGLGLLVAGCGGGSTTRRLTVSPGVRHPGSQLTFAFVAPVASGRQGSQLVSYSLSVTGPSGSGCVGVREAAAPAVGRHARARIVLGPAQLGAPWCAGPYTARVLELARAACSTGQVCPQYIRVVDTVGTTAFRVVAG